MIETRRIGVYFHLGILATVCLFSAGCDVVRNKVRNSDAGSKAPEPFFYRPDMIANARANASKYPWAAKIRDAKLKAAQAAVKLTDEQLRAIVSPVTPWRSCDCPYCESSFYTNDWTWSCNHPQDLRCEKCGKVVSLSDFPDNDAILVKDPQGNQVKIPVYARGDKKYTIRSRLSFHSFIYAQKLARDLGEAYLLTDRPEFARQALVLMRRLGEVYPGYALKDWTTFYEKPTKLSGKIGGWCYEDAIYVGNMARIYDALRCRGLVSAEDGCVIEDGLLRKAGEFLILLWSSCINDMPHRYAGIASIARVLNDTNIMAYVLLEDPVLAAEAGNRSTPSTGFSPSTFEKGFRDFVRTQWMPDGHFRNRSPGYNEMALAQLHLTPLVLADYRAAPDQPAMDLRQMPEFSAIYRALYEIAFPDGTEPVIADNDPKRYPSKTWAEILYAWYGGDENLQRLVKIHGGKEAVCANGDEFAFWYRRHDIDMELSKLRLKEASPLPSMSLPNLGIVILREPRTRTMAYLDHGARPAQGHAHFDRLGMVLWACGREMAAEIGYGKYGWNNPLREPWRIQSLSHNLVVVDRQSQRLSKTDHEPPLFLQGDGFQAAEAAAPSVYSYKQTAEYRRTLVMLMPTEGEPIVVDIFRVRGGATHDWSLHAQTELPVDVSEVTLTPGATLGTNVPYQQLKEIRTGITDRSWQATWRWPDNAGLRVWMAGAPGTAVNTARATGQMDSTVSYVIARRCGTALTSTFVAVHEPFRKQPAVKGVEVVICEQDSDDWPVVVRVDTATTRWWIASASNEHGKFREIPGIPAFPSGRLSVVRCTP